ncbi:PIN domain-containing protein [Crossiella sp. NPDC003009]
MFAALLDTCVLWPSLQRDFLLSLAVEGTYRPVWSAVILAELEYCEERKLIVRGAAPADAARRAGRLVSEMRQAFDDAEISGWEGLEGTYGLPDPDDEHVLAAAVVAGAGAVVTHNFRDFPAAAVPSGIQVRSPAEFAADAVALRPVAAVAALGHIAARSGRAGPRRTVPELLDLLADRYGMVAVAKLLRPFSQGGS